MFGLFRSKEEKEAEAIVAALDQIGDDARTELQHAEGRFSKEQKLVASACIRAAVMTLPRGMDAVNALRVSVSDLNKAGRIPETFGTMIGSRLVMAGVFLAQLKGEHWMEASMRVAAIEGLIHGFMKRAGDTPWPVSYAYDIDFERYRIAYLASSNSDS